MLTTMTGHEHRPFSIFTTSDGGIWYGCGAFSESSYSHGEPALLAYSPNQLDWQNISPPKQRIFDGMPVWKVFSLPDQEYDAAVRMHIGVLVEKFGRIAIIDRHQITDAIDPKLVTASFFDCLNEHRRDFEQTLDLLDLSLAEIGISGSCAAFRPYQLQHEIDLCVYGSEKSKHVWLKIQNLLDVGVFENVESYRQRFRFGSIEFDPQFGRSNGYFYPGMGYLSGLVIGRKLGKLRVTIENSEESIFFPAFYHTSHGPLLSFRVGHRGLFKAGDIVTLHEPVVLNVIADGKPSRALGVVNRSRIELEC